MISASHALSNSRLHQSRQRREHIDRRINLQGFKVLASILDQGEGGRGVASHSTRTHTLRKEGKNCQTIP